jgi:hypothetical protein
MINYIVVIRRKYDNPKLTGIIDAEKAWDVYHGLCKRHIKDFLKRERSSAKWHNTKQPKNTKLKQTVNVMAIWQFKKIKL